MSRLAPLVLAWSTCSATAALGQASLEDFMTSHAKTSTGNPKDSTASDLYDWSAYNRAGWRAIGKGYFDTAEHEFRAAIGAAGRPSLGDTRLLARSYADYAWAIQKQGRLAEAEPLARWALVAREALFEAGSPALAQSQNQLATLYYELGRFSEADPLLRKAVEAQAKAPKSSQAEFARSQTLLGLLLVAQRRYAEAEPPFRSAIRARERALGPSHPETGDAWNNLAWTLLDQGKVDEARPLFVRALRIFEQARGPVNPSVAHALHGSARLHAVAGQDDEAEVEFLRAIAIWDRVAPAGDAAMIEVLQHYADFLETHGRAADTARIKARLSALRGKFAQIGAKAAPRYRQADPTPGGDPGNPQRRG